MAVGIGVYFDTKLMQDKLFGNRIHGKVRQKTEQILEITT
jgi:hypothetical protein